MTGLKLVGIEYLCRVCESAHRVYVSPVDRDGELVVDVTAFGRHRLCITDCPTCDQERPHVAAKALELEGSA